jgi:hypothetical protein
LAALASTEQIRLMMRSSNYDHTFRLPQIGLLIGAVDHCLQAQRGASSANVLARPDVAPQPAPAPAPASTPDPSSVAGVSRLPALSTWPVTPRTNPQGQVTFCFTQGDAGPELANGILMLGHTAGGESLVGITFQQGSMTTGERAPITLEVGSIQRRAEAQAVAANQLSIRLGQDPGYVAELQRASAIVFRVAGASFRIPVPDAATLMMRLQACARG